MKLKPLPSTTTLQGTRLLSQFSFTKSLKDQHSTFSKKKSKLKTLKKGKSLSICPKTFSLSSEVTSDYLKSKRYSIFLKETKQDMRKTMPSLPTSSSSSREPSRLSMTKTSANLELKSLKSQDYSSDPQSFFAASKQFKSTEIVQDLESEYRTKLGSFTVFSSHEEEDFKSYYFEQQSKVSVTTQLKLQEELKNMKLPCSMTGSVFLMFKASNIGKMRALISGKPESPFADGLFLFDIFIPDGYPEIPPLLLFRTSNNTNFSFHPDLLQNGSIISNLLNTQLSGPNGWSNRCTLSQVLLHIQSKILSNSYSISPQPSEKDSKSLNLLHKFEVRVGNIENAIIPMILFPSSGFEKAIFFHFSLKYKEILERVQIWINESVFYEKRKDLSSQNPKTRSLLDSDALKLFQKLHLRLCQVIDNSFLRNNF
jgi:baculoviral IAP repeat-containing protein 6